MLGSRPLTCSSSELSKPMPRPRSGPRRGGAHALRQPSGGEAVLPSPGGIRAGLAVDVLDAHAVQSPALVLLGEELGHRAAEAADDVVLLHGDDEPRAA